MVAEASARIAGILVAACLALAYQMVVTAGLALERQMVVVSTMEGASTVKSLEKSEHSWRWGKRVALGVVVHPMELGRWSPLSWHPASWIPPTQSLGQK